MKQIDTQQLEEELLRTIKAVSNWRPLTAAIFQLLYNTGLRISEVLATGGWQRPNADEYEVQLAKREGVRRIPRDQVPVELQPYFDSHKPFTVETYSSLNNTFKSYGPSLYFENTVKTTALHAYRYLYMQKLRATGLGLTDIASKMGHLGTTATARYVSARVLLRSVS